MRRMTLIAVAISMLAGCGGERSENAAIGAVSRRTRKKRDEQRKGVNRKAE
mgnify:CR=1 FL=1